MIDSSLKAQKQRIREATAFCSRGKRINIHTLRGIDRKRSRRLTINLKRGIGQTHGNLTGRRSLFGFRFVGFHSRRGARRRQGNLRGWPRGRWNGGVDPTYRGLGCGRRGIELRVLELLLALEVDDFTNDRKNPRVIFLYLKS